MNRFSQKLQDLKARGRYRSLQLPAGIDLSSNDYLGLRTHPKMRAAALEAIQSGIDLGSGGSRLLRGHCQEHAELEEFAADYFGAERALYFATGYQANTAIFQTLPNRCDTIIYDSLIHASARDGIQNSTARGVKVPHNDLDAYEGALKRAAEKRASQNEESLIWVAVESVYSMDGDLAPLENLQKLTQKYDAVLIVDEAHGTGIFGPAGKGLCETLDHENLITLHTCGKALGVAGGLVCGDAHFVDTLVNEARPFIYSTAPMPLQAHLTKVALEIVRDDLILREQLFSLIEFSKTILPVSEINSPIVPIIIGDDIRTVEVAAALQKAGYDIRAVRPPTVPEGTARLRISLNINLSEETLKNVSDLLSKQLSKEAA